MSNINVNEVTIKNASYTELCDRLSYLNDKMELTEQEQKFYGMIDKKMSKMENEMDKYAIS